MSEQSELASVLGRAKSRAEANGSDLPTANLSSRAGNAKNGSTIPVIDDKLQDKLKSRMAQSEQGGGTVASPLANRPSAATDVTFQRPALRKVEHNSISGETEEQEMIADPEPAIKLRRVEEMPSALRNEARVSEIAVSSGGRKSVITVETAPAANFKVTKKEEAPASTTEAKQATSIMESAWRVPDSKLSETELALRRARDKVGQGGVDPHSATAAAHGEDESLKGLKPSEVMKKMREQEKAHIAARKAEEEIIQKRRRSSIQSSASSASAAPLKPAEVPTPASKVVQTATATPITDAPASSPTDVPPSSSSERGATAVGGDGGEVAVEEIDDPVKPAGASTPYRLKVNNTLIVEDLVRTPSPSKINAKTHFNEENAEEYASPPPEMLDEDLIHPLDELLPIPKEHHWVPSWGKNLLVLTGLVAAPIVWQVVKGVLPMAAQDL
mmetsp:Transcript_40961/g.49711  ORF Transcript_40961/g.49711 Transcript_40961/m.49711 type:complete len:444 (-) Transcript_40961:233-1564(-)